MEIIDIQNKSKLLFKENIFPENELEIIKKKTEILFLNSLNADNYIRNATSNKQQALWFGPKNYKLNEEATVTLSDFLLETVVETQNIFSSNEIPNTVSESIENWELGSFEINTNTISDMQEEIFGFANENNLLEIITEIYQEHS